MRYLLGLFLALAVLTVSPFGVNAQEGDEGSSRVQRWHPEAFEGPESSSQQPALQLELEEGVVEVKPTVSSAQDLERRARTARNGMIASGVIAALGVGIIGAGIATSNSYESPPGEIVILGPGAQAAMAGGVIMAGGLIGLIVSGAKYGNRNMELQELKKTEQRGSRRAHWDIGASGLRF